MVSSFVALYLTPTDMELYRRSSLRFILLMSLLAFIGLRSSAQALPVGAKAPVPAAVDQDGAAFSLADLYARGPVLVYFYPKADTPGCTAEACSLRDGFADLSREGLQVVGVSLDKPASQKAFQQKYRLPFPLLADQDGTVARAFGVPTFAGFAKRQSFLIKDGVVAWADLSASTSQQASDVRKAMAGLAR